MARKSASMPEFDPSHRIIVLHGKEAFLIRYYTQRLEEMLRETHGDFERFDFDGSSVELVTVLDELRTYGLLQQHKLVVVDQAEKFLAADQRRRPAMEALAASPPPEATLLLRAGTWRAGRFDKQVVKVGLVHKCDGLPRAELSRWAMARCAKRHDAEIDRETVGLVIDLVGTEMNRLDTELSKLAAAAGPGGTVTAALVRELVGMRREEQAWELQSALLTSRDAALTKLNELREVSQQPDELLLWSITDLSRKLHAASEGLSRGEAPGTISRRLRLFGPAERPLMSAAGRVPPRRCAQLLRSSIETTWRLRQGRATPGRALEGITVLVADTIALR